MAREIYAFEFLLIFTGVKNSKSIPTKSLIDRCENVINFEVVSKNTIKRDSSFNVYRQRKIIFEDRVIVEGSKLTNMATKLTNIAPVRNTPKPAVSIISEIKLPIPY